MELENVVATTLVEEEEEAQKTQPEFYSDIKTFKYSVIEAFKYLLSGHLFKILSEKIMF